MAATSMRARSLPRIYIVAPTYREPHAVGALLRSLEQVSYPYWELRLANANVGDETSRLVASHPLVRRVREIAVPADRYWSGTVNAALRTVVEEGCENDQVLLINSDTAFRHDVVGELASIAVSNAPAIVGAVAQVGGIVISSGIQVRSWAFAWNRHPFVGVDATALMKMPPVAVDFFPGRCVMFPVGALRKVGLVDEDALPHYAADYEFTNRLRCAGSLSALLCPAVQVESDAGNTGNDLYLQRTTLRRRLRTAFSIKSAYNPVTRLIYVWRTYPRMARPTAALMYIAKSFIEIALGGGISKRLGASGGKPQQ